MAHKTLIGGTSYEIGGGKTLVNGTAYSIDKGKTLVGGTAYEIGFGEMVNVSIVCSPAYNQSIFHCGTVTIDGEVYGSASHLENTNLSLPVGSVITCSVYGAGAAHTGTVSVNGAIVAKAAGTGSGLQAKKNTATYEYTITSDATISLTGTVNGLFENSGSITITEL